ncbi:MAG TPA: hypothetical protein VLG50_07185 [Candidatus Saccharimonadales bacterium]|nr:hypothetical protein [Candidatus Saccharimonadales bacterium]
MLTLYHESSTKCKSFSSMTCNELWDCIRYFNIDSSTIIKTGKKKILRHDLIVSLNFSGVKMNRFELKFHRIKIELKPHYIYLYGPNTFEFFKKCHDEVYQWKFYNAYGGFVTFKNNQWKGTAIYDRHFDDLFKMRKVIQFLDMRELYIKLKIIKHYMIDDIINYSMMLCCQLLNLNCFYIK